MLNELKYQRLTRELSQAKIAEALGIDRTLYTKIETGKIKPWPRVRKALAQFFDMEEKELLGDLMAK